MNKSILNEASHSAAECCTELDQSVRRNPGTALIVAIGAGIAIGLVVRALRPEPSPQYRVTRLIEDLEDRLREATTPVLRKAGAMAADGIDAAHSGEARLERLLSEATRRVRRLFS